LIQIGEIANKKFVRGEILLVLQKNIKYSIGWIKVTADSRIKAIFSPQTWNLIPPKDVINTHSPSDKLTLFDV
jgi:hypothetical protein